MTKRPLATVILAAGKGKRMRSELPKVLHPLAGLPLVQHVVDLARDVGSSRVILVVGFGGEQVIEATQRTGVEYVWQQEQLGTGHAVQQCVPCLKGFTGDLMVLSGDVPLLTKATVEGALKLHRETAAAMTLFTFIPEDAAEYGRIVRGGGGEVLRIVEHKDATVAERAIDEVNGGVYVFRSESLFPVLSKLLAKNAAGEYYITDTVGLLGAAGERLSAFIVRDPNELAGVNSPEQLEESSW